MTFIKQNAVYVAIAVITLAVGVYAVLPSTPGTEVAKELFASTVAAYGDSGCDDCNDSDDREEDNRGDHEQNQSNPPQCDISASLEVAEHGDNFTVSWNGTPSTASFYINGHSVLANDSAEYTFDGKYDYMRFTMYGENHRGDCGDEVKIVKKVTEIHGCTDKDALNHDEDATVDDGSCEYPEEKECALELVKSVDSHSAVPGDVLTYTIDITNIGTANCTGGGVRIKDVVDSNLTFLSSSEAGEISQGYGGTSLYTDHNRTLTWNGHTLVPGESGTITWTGKINEPEQCGEYAVKNIAATTAYELDHFTTWVYSNEVETWVTKACPQPPQCVSFTATPDTLAFGGGDVTLAWDTEHADTVTIDNNIGVVEADGSQVVNVTDTITYTMTVSAAGFADVHCPAPIKVLPPEEKDPITCEGNVTLTATPDVFPFGGGDTILEWTTTNVTSVAIEGEVVPTEGSKTMSVTDTTTFNLVAVGDQNTAGNEVSCPVTVTVKDPEPEPITCEANANFTATPTKLGIGGGEVTLNWSTTDAASVTLDGVAVDLDGSTTTTVTTDTMFILAVTGDSSTTGNTVSCPVDVEVEVPGPDPITCENNVTFTADPNPLPFGGGETTLTWSTDDLLSLTLDGQTVLRNDSKTFTVTDDQVFTLVAVGDQNTAGNEVTCPLTVVVEDDTDDPLTCSDVTFEASDTSVREGEKVQLSWSWGNDVTNATINNGIGDVNNNGNRTVTINGDITYVITIENDESDVACPLSINAESGGGGGGGGGSSSPRCDLDISDERIRLGEEITLTWDTIRATEVTIEDDEGNVIVTTDDKLNSDKRDLYDGEITLKPTRDTEYTLTAERGSRDRTCRVTVEVDGGVTVLETRDQEPRVAGIALTQVPYTGFEAGPMLTALFYGLLTLWALFVAYVVVLRRDVVANVSLPGAHEHTPYTEHSLTDDPEHTHTAAEYVAATMTAPAPTHLPTESPETPVVGYAAVETQTDTTEEAADFTELENHAHAHKALISSDAMRYFIGLHGTGEVAMTKLTAVIEAGKTTFPCEDGWLILNLSRVEELLENATSASVASAAPANLPIASAAQVVETVASQGVGSLAEAIVAGDVVAAYQLIAHRPMVALADAAADLDGVYRLRKGETTSASDLLLDRTADLSDAQLSAAIGALTSALDGTYNSEEEAVKMAIMKAVKSIA